MLKKLSFKTKVKKDQAGREFFALPRDIKPHHCSWGASEFYRKKELRAARKAGLLPDVFYFDALPAHVAVARGAVLAAVCVSLPHGL